jgi:phosphoserine phosphatase
MGLAVASFDVDQTLVQGYTERLFFRDPVRRGPLSVARVLAYLGQVARRPQDRFQDKSSLEGLKVEEVVSLARRCYREAIAPRVSPTGLACVLEHQAQGPNKLWLLQKLARTHGFDLSQSYAYGDDIQDAYLFRSIGHPVAINPSWRLKLKARKHSWPVRYFRP